MNVVSLFSGAGGFDLGFKAAGFRTLLASDNWKLATDTLDENSIADKVLPADVREMNFNRLLKKKPDVLIGGPPCPAYSKSRFYRKEKTRGVEDEDGRLLFEYIRALEELKPKAFVFENVHGFVYKPHARALEILIKETKKLGFKLSYRVVNAADYGVPQIRERFICVGVRNSMPDFIWPEARFSEQLVNRDDETSQLSFRLAENSSVRPWRTAGDAIGDLDIDMPGDDDLRAGSKHKHLLPLIPPGQNYLFFTKERGHPSPLFKWRSRYWSFLLKLSPAMPSWTIQASFSNNMGPFHWKNRFLRIAEIKRLQTFPDSYKLEGKFRDQWRLIGNAVPPKLAEEISVALRDQYFDK